MQTMTRKNELRSIEKDDFPFEFVSVLAERESWRKEVHRPIYHVHKWWAKRLGSVFRGILLGCMLEDGVEDAFFEKHSFLGRSVFDPFMGSGTTVGEAHKLGFAALGRDINPVAVEAVRVALGPLDEQDLKKEFARLREGVGAVLRGIYTSTDSVGRQCDVLYRFWVMQATCPGCTATVDLFNSPIFARNAYPKRKPEVQAVCPECGDVFCGLNHDEKMTCPNGHTFDPHQGTASGSTATCRCCSTRFKILDAVGEKRPAYREYAKLVLTVDGEKEYLRATAADSEDYAKVSKRLNDEVSAGNLVLPDLSLECGYNTKQAMSYGFKRWNDFFNDRQLFSLLTLRKAICETPNPSTREALLTLFSGVLEFNNLFASYKGEGTGAVRHMFAHHILKPERMPIEANVWGTPRSSGAFSTLFKSKLLRAIAYRKAPTEVSGVQGERGPVCSNPITGAIEEWPVDRLPHGRTVALSRGDSASTKLPAKSVDFVVTDPPFFDNVHYSELADFFYAWRSAEAVGHSTTRHEAEVQDTDAKKFSEKLQSVFRECHRVLKDDGLLVFTYHHSREDGWSAVGDAVLSAGFVFINAHPIKAEMSVATPKAQAKEPIQLDTVLVCRKQGNHLPATHADALESASEKSQRLRGAGFKLSRNDEKVILFGQLLTTLSRSGDRFTVPQVAEAKAAVSR